MPRPELDVAAWVARARDDPDAARQLCDHLYPLVMRIVRAHRPRSLSEEDLAQEVFLKMFANLDRYEPRAGIPFEHWVSRLSVRTCLDALRAERRQPTARPADLGDGAREWLLSLSSDAAHAPAGDALAARELVDVLLSRLPPSDRLVLTLLDLEEKPVAEIAAITGWSRGLVKVRAFRARRRLRAVAEEMGVTSP
ncbi:MAG: sigma-70 family RNA polymerase sigma factor [Acidobacteriota bacterium]